MCDTTSPTPLCDTATVFITVAPVNDPPVYTGPGTIAVPVGGLPGPLPISDPEDDPWTVRIIDGTVPDGVVLNPDGTWGGSASTPGTFPITIEACDNRVPPACSQSSIVIEVSLLPATGMSVGSIGLVGALLMGAGWLALLEARRRERSYPGAR